MVLFPAIGLLLWIAFLFIAFVLSGVLWVLCRFILGFVGMLDQAARRQRSVPATPRRNVPPPQQPAPSQATFEITPKWTAARRHYVDWELAVWQEQFDALSTRKL